MNRCTIIRLTLAFALLAISGCQALRPAQQTEPEPPESSLGIENIAAEHAKLLSLFSYYRDLTGWSEQVIDDQIEVMRALLGTGCSERRLRLALALLHQGAATEPGLLESCQQSDTGPATAKLALLLEDQLKKHAQRQAALREALAELEQRKQENVELRRQLDGLRAIERSLQGRDRPQQQGAEQ